MYYVVYRISDGAMVSDSVNQPSNLPAGLSSKSFPDKPNMALNHWDAANLIFVPNPAERNIERLTFYGRFTPVELLGFLGGYIDTGIVLAERKKIAAFMTYVSTIERVNLDAQLIDAGMTALVNAGIITAQRKIEILT